jgi:hypothetical protein
MLTSSGTYIPLTEGIALATKYNGLQKLFRLFNFEIADISTKNAIEQPTDDPAGVPHRSLLPPHPDSRSDGLTNASSKTVQDAGAKGHDARGDDGAFADCGWDGTEDTSVVEGHTQHLPEVLSGNSVTKTDVKNVPE